MYDFKMTARLRTNIMKQRPIFEQKNFSFRREEKEGYISVRSTNLPRLQELFLNRTTQNILKKCNGSNTVEQIIRIISDMYPDIQRQVIANDVVKNLSVLSRFQLIEWKERNPFMKKLCVAFEGNKEFELLDEGDIREIITFIKANAMYDESVGEKKEELQQLRDKEEKERISATNEKMEREQFKLTCPACGSKSVQKISTVGKYAKVGMFGILGADDLGKTWKCKVCGCKF